MNGLSGMNNNKKLQRDHWIIISVVALTIVMIVLRIFLNEKGRISPDSIRFMRFANVLPVIDNTTTPLGYPLILKFFSYFTFSEFWSSKIVGILSYLSMVCFAWKKNFYFREVVLTGGLFSFVSIFAATLSESFTLPFVFLLLYISQGVIHQKYNFRKGTLLLTLALLAIFNVRYSGLFIMGASFLFGLLSLKKSYGKQFIISSLIGFAFIVLYKFLFIDTFNETYLDGALEIAYYPTSKLIPEFFAGVATSFNPFIHMTDPGGSILNIGIYGIGAFTVLVLIYFMIKKRGTKHEMFFIITGVSGILCSFFIQYFYVVDPINYRLISMFTLPLWLFFFSKIKPILGMKTYLITFLSMGVGVAFMWMARGNYLENRAEAVRYLKVENLEETPLLFYAENYEDGEAIDLAELFSTVQSNLTLTFKKEDTLRRNTLTKHKVLQKIKLDENKYR